MTVLGKEFVKVSLKTSSYRDAAKLARKLSYEYDVLFDQVRQEQTKEGYLPPLLTGVSAPVPDSSPVPVSSHHAVLPAASLRRPEAGPSTQRITLRQLYERYMGDPAIVRTPRTVFAYETAYTRLLELLDGDTPIDSITREDCRHLLDAIRTIPSNATKKYGWLPLDQLVTKAKADKQPLMSATTVNSYIQKLSALLNWAVKEDYLVKNPARGLKVVDPVRRKDKRHPFSPQQLNTIFNAPIYRGCADDEYGYSRPGPNRPRRSKFWIPLIALYSGMRLNEICQMNKEDIRDIDGISCFMVTTDATITEDKKRLKTANAERVVPIHPMLLEIGILDFVASNSGSSNYKLFEDVRRTSTGYYSDDFTRWFRHFLIHCKAKTAKTSFHSFRHNFRDAMRKANVDREITYAIGGWASGAGDEGSVTAENYGLGYPVKMLFEAISKIDYPDLDLSHIMPLSATKP